MNVVEVLRLPLSVDLSGFVGLLRRLQVPHRVSEEAGQQVLWVSEPLADDVRQLYQRFPEGNDDIQLPAADPAVPARPSIAGQLRASKATAAILLLCLLVAGLTGLGDNWQTLSWLTFLDFRVQGDYLIFTPLAESLGNGQWWRLITPMLVHFGILHLAMNGLWFWELGRRIELRQGALSMLGLSLLFGLVSNVAQYLFGGPSLFGGLSGVLYGLLGHIWLYQWLAPNPVYRMPKGVLVMMLIWLVLCMSGLVSLLGFGQIANAAHVGGLLVGCLSGLLGGALARRKLFA
ncbi:rhomboid family intramembrane serine protease [Pseudomonas sp. SDI]|uniref:rhomboid family intramembrane serine protease n=1 Tax=Pseudomonas sp. SDI TaxID=2170734 RepID=UPI000DE7547D|nr:rhomboid family intramembrane serine protease [Pseudomonas sp. SDI]PWB31510.1 rhomboid family intramembrane serine protease [Pseudomonas sp. SDI]